MSATGAEIACEVKNSIRSAVLNSIPAPRMPLSGFVRPSPPRLLASPAQRVLLANQHAALESGYSG